MTQQPTQSEYVAPPSATHLPPTEDDEPGPRLETPASQIKRIERFLVESGHDSPARPRGDTTADTVIRLLTQMGASGLQVPRCDAEYCNLVRGHTTEHGWVNV